MSEPPMSSPFKKNSLLGKNQLCGRCHTSHSERFYLDLNIDKEEDRIGKWVSECIPHQLSNAINKTVSAGTQLSDDERQAVINDMMDRVTRWQQSVALACGSEFVLTPEERQTVAASIQQHPRLADKPTITTAASTTDSDDDPVIQRSPRKRTFKHNSTPAEKTKSNTPMMKPPTPLSRKSSRTDTNRPSPKKRVRDDHHSDHYFDDGTPGRKGRRVESNDAPETTEPATSASTSELECEEEDFRTTVPEIMAALDEAEAVLSAQVFSNLRDMVGDFSLRQCGKEVKNIIESFVAAHQKARR